VIQFVVEGHPVPAPRITHGSRWRERVQRYMAYREQVAIAARNAGVGRLTGPCELAIRVWVKPGHQGDWDNYGKTVSDALLGIAYEDDRQVRKATVEIVPVFDRDLERLEVRIGPLDGSANSCP